MAKLRVAMMAPPWLKIPPKGYGGIEYVVNGLVVELKKLDVDVELFTVGETAIPGIKTHFYYEKGQYNHISMPLYDVVTIPVTQILFSLNYIREAGDFDIIHDHNGFLGPAITAYLDPRYFPRVLHTTHGPFSNDAMVANGMPDNRPTYAQFTNNEHLFFNGISKAQMLDAPKELSSRIVDVVYNAIDTSEYPFESEKDNYFITLARFARDKGQAKAAKYCEELGLKLRMAGVIDGIDDPRRLLVELANVNSTHRNNADFLYYRDDILPRLIPGQIDYIGSVSGNQKMKFINKARALLFPIDWEEPFGLAVIEALACGTPVVAMHRGALPEIIEHGYNGFLAKTENEFKEYMLRVKEIKPENCRESVERKFSAKVMAQQYLDRYQQIIAADIKPR